VARARTDLPLGATAFCAARTAGGVRSVRALCARSRERAERVVDHIASGRDGRVVGDRGRPWPLDGFGVGAVADARYLGLQVDRAGQRRQRGNQANGESFEPVLSADGRFVAFTSDASNLVPDDTNGDSNVFVRDNRIGQTERVGVGPAGEQLSRTTLAGISDDGRYVAFTGRQQAARFRLC
jgi:WD40-like Beta Propeller Repeat